MRNYILCLASLTILTLACKKDKYSSATVIDTGDVTSEGCGYILRMSDGKDEKPDHLPSAFQHNNLKVKVKIRHSGILDTCQFDPPHVFYERVYIEDIKKDI
jgi:hypothetical protein